MSFSWAHYAPRGYLFQPAIYYKQVYPSPLGCQVVLKQMAFDSLSDAVEAAAEVERLAATSHSAIDPVLDFDFDSNGRFLLSVATARKVDVGRYPEPGAGDQQKAPVA